MRNRLDPVPGYLKRVDSCGNMLRFSEKSLVLI